MLEGVRILLAPGGVASLEFPHLLPLMRDTALDRFHLGQTFYLSLLVAELLAWQHGLTVFDAEALPAGGGALRLFLRHVEDTARPVTPEVQRIRAEERAAGLEGAEAYARFARFVVEAKCALLDFLVGLRRAGRRVAGYGVPARGSALLSYCGIGPELLPFVVDPDAGLEGCTLPGARIPVLGPEAVLQERPDYLLLLSAHRREEAEARLPAIRGWGGRLALPGPTLRVV